MPLGSLLPSPLGTAVYAPGAPGGAGGPGGVPAPAYNSATGIGAGWEVKVVAAPDYHLTQAVIPSSVLTGLQFVMQIDAQGSGTVTLDADAPFWDTTLPNGQAASYLLDYEHVWQVWQDGINRFEFLGETVTEQLADPSEQRVITVTGPGTIAVLGWADAMPPGFPHIIYKLDAITDSFDEIDTSGNLVLDTGLWNVASPAADIALNPAGTCQLTGSAGTTVLGTTVFDATTTLISAQVYPIVSPDQNNVTLDGSQLTQFYIQDVSNSSFYALIGMSGTAFYCQYSGPGGTQTQVIATAAAFAAMAQGNQGYAYWQISENDGVFYFWTSPDGQNWTLQMQADHAGWDPVQVGFYFSARYDSGSAEFAQLTAINSDVTTSSLAGALYFDEPIMDIWLQNLAAAQARGTIPFVTTGQLSASTDSFGNPWTDSQSVQIQNGTDLYTLLQAHAGMINADYVMMPGFRLVAGIPTATGVITLGTDRSADVIFRDGRDCMSRVRTRARNQISNLIGVINADGRTVTADDTSSAALWGQREAWVQAAVQVTTADLNVVADASVEQNGDEILSWTLQILPFTPGKTVFANYQPGDWVGLERPDFSAVDAVRVMAIAVQVGADGTETHELTLVSYVQWLQEQLQYLVTKMGGGFLSAAGTTAVAGNGSITNLNAPSVFSISLAGLTDTNTSGTAHGTPMVYDAVTGTWVPAGSVNPDSGASRQVTVPGGNGVTVIGGGTVTTTATSPSTGSVTTTTTGVLPDGSTGVATSGGDPPPVPDLPAVYAGMLGIIVGWDGLLAGAAPPAGFSFVQVHVSTVAGFTPSASTLQGTMHTGGLFGVGNLTAGTAYYAVLVAVSQGGVASAPSSESSAVPTSTSASIGPGQIAGTQIATGAITSAQIAADAAITGSQLAADAGITAGQVGFTASAIGAQVITFSATQPAGPKTGDLWYDTASGNTLYTYNGTAWVQYQWGTGSLAAGSVTEAQVSFTAAQIGGITTSVGTTAPTSPNVGDLWFNGNSSYQLQQWNGSAWAAYQFGTGAIAANSVTAALIAANTITATQIASGTITAAQIKSGTITASQIAASTITGALIAANTISAANIVSGTITATQIASGTITATQIASGTITASQIASGTITTGLLASGIVVAGIVNGTTLEGSTLILDGTAGQVLAYSGTPSAGNLINAIAGSSGTDSYGNSYPQGLLSEQLTLTDWATGSGPPAFGGASVFFSSDAGRPRYLSSAGSSSILDRSTVNVSQFTVGNTTTPEVISAVLDYSANEGAESSEFEIEIMGVGNNASASPTETLLFALFSDGVNLGGQFTAGAAAWAAGASFGYQIRFLLSLLSTSAAVVSSAGILFETSANRLPSNSVAVGNQSQSVSFDATSSHTLEIFAWWGGTSSGQVLTTARTSIIRRD